MGSENIFVDMMLAFMVIFVRCSLHFKTFIGAVFVNFLNNLIMNNNLQ